MTREDLKTVLQKNKFVCAIKDDDGLNNVLKSENKVVFILYGSVMNICDIVKKLKSKNKITFVHIDLIEGLSSKEVAVEFIAKNTGADGIITTKQVLVKSAASHGLLTVQRFFLIDSLAFDNLKKQLNNAYMDVVEVLPACSTKTITEITKLTDLPIIASGMIRDKDDINEAILAGATAISGTNLEILQ